MQQFVSVRRLAQIVFVRKAAQKCGLYDENMYM